MRGLVGGIIFMMILPTLASNRILANATPSSDGVSTAGQCDLYQQSSTVAAFTPVVNQSDNNTVTIGLPIPAESQELEIIRDIIIN
jgi:hypothetical protein